MAISALKFIGLALGAVALGVVSTTFAFGQMEFGAARSNNQGLMGWMAKTDANKDGAITVEEIKSMRNARFARFDHDGDGAVSKGEVEAAVKERVERMTKRIVLRFDKDRDGTITRAEFNRFAEERFSWLDLNEDGKVSRDEMPRRMRHIMWR